METSQAIATIINRGKDRRYLSDGDIATLKNLAKDASAEEAQLIKDAITTEKADRKIAKDRPKDEFVCDAIKGIVESVGVSEAMAKSVNELAAVLFESDTIKVGGKRIEIDDNNYQLISDLESSLDEFSKIDVGGCLEQAKKQFDPDNNRDVEAGKLYDYQKKFSDARDICNKIVNILDQLQVTDDD